MNRKESEKVSRPPAPGNQENFKKKTRILKRKLSECQKEKEDILNQKKIELKNKEDEIEELKYKLKQQEETPSSSPENTDLINELQEENKDLKEENEQLILESNQLEERVEELGEKKKSLNKELEELKEENKRLLRELDKYKDEGKIGFNLPSGAEIRGDIESDDIIQVENNVKILGSLKSKKDIVLGHENEVKGDIISDEGAVKIGNASEIGGLIRGEEVRLAEGVTANQVQARDKIFIERNCKVSDIFALGDVNLGEDVEVDGSLEYAGNFDASKGVKITKAVMPRSKEELQEKSKDILTEKPAFPPVIVRGESEEPEDVAEKERAIMESVEDMIDDVRSMMKSARSQDIDISEERNILSQGASHYKEGEYEKAEELVSECHTDLKEKLSELSEEKKREGSPPLSTVIEGVESELSEVGAGETEEITSSKEEVLKDFTSIKGIGPSVAERLYEGGFDSLKKLKSASLKDLQNVEGIGKAFSRKIKENISSEE
ncbi:MAG: helix-hairpin-helix domain-containing protein [Candidatus Thermoplasmatota archaeon]